MQQPPSKHEQLRKSEAEAQALIDLPEDQVTPEVRQRISFLESEVTRLRAELGEARKRVSELVELADRDPLIEIMNRRAFVRELSRVMAAVERYNFKSNFVYIDLNGLKSINDNHGHAAGDAVLKRIGETLAAQIRQTDAVGRLGGDEFGLLLTHTSTEMAEMKMSQLASIISAKPMIWNNCALQVSISYGVFPILQGHCIEETLIEADRAMYAQKNAARQA
ncbi:MAG: GGDEF domain-containing protein [Aquisalinus sp.]|nr:GGDEF domain-containing protein [Aquisalinus sp.]